MGWPSMELCARWAAAGAWYPYARFHHADGFAEPFRSARTHPSGMEACAIILTLGSANNYIDLYPHDPHGVPLCAGVAHQHKQLLLPDALRHVRDCVFAGSTSPGTACCRWQEVARVSQVSFNWRLRALPALYTAFFEARVRGCPIARPLAFAFPGDMANTRGVHLQWLLGDGLLVSPVVGLHCWDDVKVQGEHVLCASAVAARRWPARLAGGGHPSFRVSGSTRAVCTCSGCSAAAWPSRQWWALYFQGTMIKTRSGHLLWLVTWSFTGLAGDWRPALCKHLASSQTALDYQLTGLTGTPRLQLSHVCHQQVTEAATSVTAYLPPGTWYSLFTLEAVDSSVSGRSTTFQACSHGCV